MDTDEAVLTRGREAAISRGLESRVTFTAEVGEAYGGKADVVICVGSTHALDASPAETMRKLRQLVAPGGRLLLGEGFWEPHGPVDTDLVWDDMLAMPDLAGLVEQTIEAGFRPVHVETASVGEWEEFESGYALDLESWLLEHPDHPDVAKTRAAADEHRARWLRGYRNALGFAYLTLGVPV